MIGHPVSRAPRRQVMRQGMTLIEIAASLVVLGMVLQIGATLLVELANPPQVDPTLTARCGRLCDRLRQDCASGAVIPGDGADDSLVTLAGRYQVIEGTLMRDDQECLPVERATWRRDGDAWLITIKCAGLHPREIRVVGPVLAQTAGLRQPKEGQP
jgi:prepilin-type N-terminal cleavage/methylation domain-containing protein